MPRRERSEGSRFRRLARYDRFWLSGHDRNVESALDKGEPWDSLLHDPSLLGRATEVDRNALDHAGLHLDGAGH